MKPLLCLFVALSLTLAAASEMRAAKLYKYRDDNGTWSFSDRPPAGGELAAVEQVAPTELPRKVSIRRSGPKEATTLIAVNEYFGPVEVEADLTQKQNVAVSRALPARVVVPAAREADLFTLRPVDPRRGWSYTSSLRFVPGDPAAVHDPPAPYQLPFPPDRRVRITQAFHGASTHNDPQNEYAVDFALPEGTPVLAARAGRVMEVAQDFIDGGTEKRYQERANFVCILHDDGTMAVYAHLELETAQVVPGTWVAEGQFLARSGNTGFSSGPHLHFVVQKNAGMRLVSIPFVLAGPTPAGVTPQEGMVLGGGR